MQVAERFEAELALFLTRKLCSFLHHAKVPSTARPRPVAFSLLFYGEALTVRWRRMAIGAGLTVVLDRLIPAYENTPRPSRPAR